MILEGVTLLIYEISVETELFKLSHRTEEVGEGLAILLPAQ